ncbi:putative leader peptide [Streptomyces sp. YIM 130001]
MSVTASVPLTPAPYGLTLRRHIDLGRVSSACCC